MPVPLNSSKITSSIRLPVSMSAVAMIVKLPPSSTFLAAPKKRFGLCRALESSPPERILPLGGTVAAAVDKLTFTEDHKVFDPKDVYGDAPNPTKL